MFDTTDKIPVTWVDWESMEYNFLNDSPMGDGAFARRFAVRSLTADGSIVFPSDSPLFLFKYSTDITEVVRGVTLTAAAAVPSISDSTWERSNRCTRPTSASTARDSSALTLRSTQLNNIWSSSPLSFRSETVRLCS